MKHGLNFHHKHMISQQYVTAKRWKAYIIDIEEEYSLSVLKHTPGSITCLQQFGVWFFLHGNIRLTWALQTVSSDPGTWIHTQVNKTTQQMNLCLEHQEASSVDVQL
jgi:L-rhamnose isomerase